MHFKLSSAAFVVAMVATSVAGAPTNITTASTSKPHSSSTTITTTTTTTATKTTTTSSAGSTATPSLAPPVFNIPPFVSFNKSYPPVNVIPPTDVPQVQEWVAAINMSAVPDFPVVPWDEIKGEPKDIGNIPAASCDWTVTNCINGDLTTCPLGSWGLTYDDGPTEHSPRLYDFLDQSQQKATLFYIGSQVLEFPQYAHRACAAGHHIAVHTWSHHASTSLTNEQFIAEVKYTEQAIAEVCNMTATYFRPPYGDIDDRIRGLLTQMGYHSVLWDYDTEDWNMPPKTENQVDADFDTWVKNAPNDTTGHITLQHELSNESVTAAITNLPKVQATWKTMPVAACMNNPYPYVEHQYVFPTLNGTSGSQDHNSTTTVSHGTSTSTSTATVTTTAH